MKLKGRSHRRFHTYIYLVLLGGQKKKKEKEQEKLNKRIGETFNLHFSSKEQIVLLPRLKLGYLSQLPIDSLNLQGFYSICVYVIAVVY